MRKFTFLSLLFCLVLSSSQLFAQEQEPMPPKALAELNASLAEIQNQLDELGRKKRTLESERAALIERLRTAEIKSAIEGMKIVVRVPSERSVVLLINGRDQEVFLSGVAVKLEREKEAIEFLKRQLLLVGVAYPRCKDAACSEVELFAGPDQLSLNCQLVESGLAILLAKHDLPCASTAVLDTVDEAGKSATSDVISADDLSGSGSQSGAASPERVPGTDVKVRGYYRKDGTYVRPHTRSAPGRRRN